MSKYTVLTTEADRDTVKSTFADLLLRDAKGVKERIERHTTFGFKDRCTVAPSNLADEVGLEPASVLFGATNFIETLRLWIWENDTGGFALRIQPLVEYDPDNPMWTDKYLNGLEKATAKAAANRIKNSGRDAHVDVVKVRD